MPVKAMEHILSQNDPNVTPTTGTAKIMTDIVVYKVPRHTVIELRPQDIFSAYLKDAGAEMLGTDQVQLLLRDPNNLTQEIIYTGLYEVLKEFQDAQLVKHVGLAKLIPSDFQLVIQAQATTILVVANCYWQITCKRWANLL
jgi:hypothetical protein